MRCCRQRDLQHLRAGVASSRSLSTTCQPRRSLPRTWPNARSDETRLKRSVAARARSPSGRPFAAHSSGRQDHSRADRVPRCRYSRMNASSCWTSAICQSGGGRTTGGRYGAGTAAAGGAACGAVTGAALGGCAVAGSGFRGRSAGRAQPARRPARPGRRPSSRTATSIETALSSLSQPIHFARQACRCRCHIGPVLQYTG